MENHHGGGAQRPGKRSVQLDPEAADPAPHVMHGDEVYVRDPQTGQPTHGRVIAKGLDGCQIQHPEGIKRVHWQHVLGHRTRNEIQGQVVDQGEDGVLVKDLKSGVVHYIANGPAGKEGKKGPSEEETSASMLADMEKRTPLTKSFRYPVLMWKRR